MTLVDENFKAPKVKRSESVAALKRQIETLEDELSNEKKRADNAIDELETMKDFTCYVESDKLSTLQGKAESFENFLVLKDELKNEKIKLNLGNENSQFEIDRIQNAIDELE